MVKYISEEIDAPGGDWEDLVISLYFELQIHSQVFSDLGQQFVQG